MPHFVLTAVFRLEERTVYLSVEASAHVVLQAYIDAVVAGVTLVHHGLIEVVVVAIHGAEGRAVDAHRRVEAVVEVGAQSQVQVVVELMHVGYQHVVCLRQAEVLIRAHAVLLKEVGIHALHHGMQTVAQREGVAVVDVPLHAYAGLQAEVLGEEEVGGCDTEVDGEPVSELKDVLPVGAAQSGVAPGIHKGGEGVGGINVVGGAAVQTEESV